MAVALTAAFTAPAFPALGQTASAAQVDALRSAASSNRQLASFYAARGNRPVWFAGTRLTPTGSQLVDLIARADLDGLDPDDYRADRLRQAVDLARSGQAADVARAEVAISRALIDYARDLPRRPSSDLAYVDKALRPKPPKAAVILAAAGAGAPIEQIVQIHPLYIQMRTGYAAWRTRWANLPEIGIPAGPNLAGGATGERVRLLRARLGLPAGTAFDARLAAQVRTFKEAHGLPATPVVDAQTVSMLNLHRGVIDARIRLNLVRARQLPAPDMGRHLVVDAAGQRLLLYDGGRLADSMKVIVGKPSEPTPMMAAYVRYTTINPYWNVPPDLAASRVAQNVVSDGLGYLEAKGYEVLSDWTTRAQILDPAAIDWQAVADGRISLRVRQRPGAGNMMGAMKFMFPNKFGVYLHDTPEKLLFGEGDRRRSSGCVRLEDAPRLARWLYGRLPTAPSGSQEYNVPLPRPVPVFITYLTVAPTQGGLAFRDDVYGRDRLSGARYASAD